ncbi:FAD/NAD(P)-binding domain-containing protein [Coprinellus micaceus]|uniref:FAD/NAD(P)-binding domain-containing protein n=1 Tax=Coprinellus micaceus TaxID=71717 RepID=A0A4Y7SX99_COPMI|nr:FAD/NAD(P)-binding domain-containing protein [Coprinellus micaceus]
MSAELILKTKVLIVGGGPGGSYAASVLAREGIQVTLLEAAKFPRYHIGESMLPSLKLFLRYIDAEQKVKDHGFCVKPGAAVKLNQFKREGYTDFIRHDPENWSWNVVRSEFDEILLRHAEESSATVLEEHKVTEILFGPDADNNPAGRPVSARFTCPAGEGIIHFDYLVDASGRNGMMSTKYLKNRRMNQSLKNVACWGYWHGDLKMYKPGTGRENAPWFEALTDESGWAWFIPLQNGVVSIGVVMNQDIATKKKSGRRAKNADFTLKDHYLEQLRLAPGVLDLLGNGALVDGNIKSAGDYSYSSDRYSGENFRIVGDAGAFIDPFFSSGVHLAILGGLTAALTIAAPLRGHCNETVASEFYSIKTATAYTRFLVVVMSVYRQIRNQSEDVLTDLNEDNFDRAFDILRPVIQGTADVGKELTEDELDKTMDFCRHVFAPADNDTVADVASRFAPELLSIAAPVFSAEELNQVIDPEDTDAAAVINRINSAKVLGAMWVKGPAIMENEPVNGMVARLERGKLGLAAADQSTV